MTPHPGDSEPTVYEMIRTLSLKMDVQAQATARLEGTVNGLVTQEQRRTDNELITMRLAHAETLAATGNERVTWWARAGMIGVGFPVLVGIIMWVGGATIAMPST